MNRMDAPFYTPSSSVNRRDILKHWVMEPSKFKMTPNHIYKTNTLKKVYQFLEIFACRLYDQGSMETFSQSWVVMLDQIESEGKPFN